MVVRQRDWLLDVIDQAAAAIVAMVTQDPTVAQPELESEDPERALDELFPGLDAHAQVLDRESLRGLLRTDGRALVFARLQARRGLLLIGAGELDAGRARIDCAHDLLALLAGRPGPTKAAAQALLDALAPVRDVSA